jgi:hypothetical protein
MLGLNLMTRGVKMVSNRRLNSPLVRRRLGACPSKRTHDASAGLDRWSQPPCQDPRMDHLRPEICYVQDLGALRQRVRLRPDSPDRSGVQQLGELPQYFPTTAT